MLNARQKRLDRSRQNNLLHNERKRTASDENSSTSFQSKRAKVQKNNNKRSKLNSTKSDPEKEIETFAGTTSKPGAKRPMGKYFLKKQAAIHAENVKQRKKQAKSQKQMIGKKREIISMKKKQ